jgi:hypothetical protein
VQQAGGAPAIAYYAGVDKIFLQPSFDEDVDHPELSTDEQARSPFGAEVTLIRDSQGPQCTFSRSAVAISLSVGGFSTGSSGHR